MTPDRLLLINAILALPKTMPEKELQRDILAFPSGMSDNRPKKCVSCLRNLQLSIREGDYNRYISNGALYVPTQGNKFVSQ
jgi:hypothetical protein